MSKDNWNYEPETPVLGFLVVVGILFAIVWKIEKLPRIE